MNDAIISLRLSQELYDQAEALSEKEDRPLSSWVRNLIKNKVAQAAAKELRKSNTSEQVSKQESA